MTVVVLSAFVPTIIAQQFFEPDVNDLLGVNETSGEEDFTSFRRPIHHGVESMPVADSDGPAGGE